MTKPKKCMGCGADLKEIDDRCPICGRLYSENEIILQSGPVTAVSAVPAARPAERPAFEPDQQRFRFRFIEINGEEGYAVCGIEDSSIDVVKIPSEYMGKPVLTIDKYAFQNKKSIRCVQIPESIGHIGESAFEGCINLETISGGEGLLFIGTKAFRGCIHFKTDLAKNPRTGFEPDTFAGCYHLHIR